MPLYYKKQIIFFSFFGILQKYFTLFIFFNHETHERHEKYKNQAQKVQTTFEAL